MNPTPPRETRWRFGFPSLSIPTIFSRRNSSPQLSHQNTNARGQRLERSLPPDLMTRNNLGEHLSWLARNSDQSRPIGPLLPSVHQNSAPTASSSSLPNSSFHTQTTSSNQLAGRVGRREIPAPPPPPPLNPSTFSTSTSTSSSIPPDDARRPPITYQGGSEFGSTVRGMAKLSSNSASNRPLLVTKQQQQQQHLQLLTPRSTTAARGSLQQAYSASLAREPPPGTDRLRKKTSTIAHQAPRHWSPNPSPENTELERVFSDPVDLTEADSNDGSSSVVGVEEEDRVSRTNGQHNKGNKGKNKYQDTTNYPELPDGNSDGDDSFPDIRVLMKPEARSPSNQNSISSQNTGTSRSQSFAKNAASQQVSRKSTERGMRVDAAVAIQNSSAPPHSTRTPTRPVTGSVPSPPSRKRKSTNIPALESANGSLGGTSSKKARRSDIVYDSEDEDFMTPPTHLSLRTGGSSFTDGYSCGSTTRELEELDPSILESRAPSRVSLESQAKTSNSESRYDDHDVEDINDNDEDIDDDEVMEDAEEHSETKPDKGTSQDSDIERNKHVLKLLLSNPSVIERRLDSVTSQLRRNHEQFMKFAREGKPKEARDTVRRAREPLDQQKKSLTQILTELTSFKELSDKREALLAELAAAYKECLDTNEEENQLDVLSEELRTKETLLISSLLTAGIDDLDFLKDPNDSIAAPDSPTPVVFATQPSRKFRIPSLSTEISAIPEYNSQVILQTQVSYAGNGSGQSSHPQKTPQPLPEKNPQPLPHKTSQTLPQKLPPLQCKPSETGPAEFAGERSFIEIDDETFDEDDDFFDLEEAQATSCFKTSQFRRQSPVKVAPPPAPAPAPNYIDDYSDDEDMLAAMHEIERRSLSAPSIEPKRAKSAFSEASVNAPKSVLSEASGNARLSIKPRALAKRVASTQPRPSIPPDLMKYPWSADVRRALKDRFRMSGFRHNQLEAINATLSGKDAFVLMPTGGGKSLCYQLPAVIRSGHTRGLTIVISPLLSLMQDQVDHLKALNVTAESFNGDMNPELRRHALSLFDQPNPENSLQLLYVTPEMVNKSQAFVNGLSKLHRNNRLARIVIDEAHCVSQWGHDFRPDYKALGVVRRRFPGVPVMALTATATKNVITDVKHNLGMDDCEVFSQSFNRPNLYYEVRVKRGAVVDQIGELITQNYPDQTGIVYTLSRSSAETTAKNLRDKFKITAQHYHASIEPPQRAQIQKDWQAGKTKVVVATIAFGMGIDKADVRFVIHQNLPKSLEGYYQETGRAGRDGKQAHCYLFFGYGDITSLRRMISNGDGDYDQKERQHNMLNRTVTFCENTSTCRRVDILRYFDEEFSAADCNNGCDNCRSGRTNGITEAEDFTKYAVAILEIVRSAGSLPLGKLADILIGKKPKEFQHYPNWGFAKELAQHEAQRIIVALHGEGGLGEDNKVNKASFAVTYYVLGRAAQSFFQGQRKLMLQVWKRAPDSRLKKKSSRTPVLETTESSGLPPLGPPQARMPPPSTMVSSPVRAASKRRRTPSAPRHSVAKYGDDEFDSHGALHANGYEKDDFVVSDEDNNAFEPVPPHRLRPSVSKHPRQQTLHELGPPISKHAQGKNQKLNEVHQEVVEHFLEEAKVLEERIRNGTGLRRAIFTEQQLREMAAHWTTSAKKMYSIDGLDKEKVDKFGVKFLPLLNNCHRNYRDMMGLPANSAVEHSATNHDVVDLVTSDEEEEFEGDDIDFMNNDEEEEALESSRYFPNRGYAAAAAVNNQLTPAAPRDVAAQNWREEFERLSSQQPQRTSGTAATATASGKKSSGSGWKGGKKSYGKKFGGRPRAASAARSTSSAGVSKRKASGARRGPSAGPGAAGSSGARGRGSSSTAAKKTSYTSGIATMPL